MNVLVIDVGGAHIKLLASGQSEVLKIPSGSDLTPQRMVADVLEATKDWSCEVVSIGFPGPIANGKSCPRAARIWEAAGWGSISLPPWAGPSSL